MHRRHVTKPKKGKVIRRRFKGNAPIRAGNEMIRLSIPVGNQMQWLLHNGRDDPRIEKVINKNFQRERANDMNAQDILFAGGGAVVGGGGGLAGPGIFGGSGYVSSKDERSIAIPSAKSRKPRKLIGGVIGSYSNERISNNVAIEQYAQLIEKHKTFRDLVRENKTKRPKMEIDVKKVGEELERRVGLKRKKEKGIVGLIPKGYTTNIYTGELESKTEEPPYEPKDLVEKRLNYGVPAILKNTQSLKPNLEGLNIIAGGIGSAIGDSFASLYKAVKDVLTFLEGAEQGGRSAILPGVVDYVKLKGDESNLYQVGFAAGNTASRIMHQIFVGGVSIESVTRGIIQSALDGTNYVTGRPIDEGTMNYITSQLGNFAFGANGRRYSVGEAPPIIVQVPDVIQQLTIPPHNMRVDPPTNDRPRPNDAPATHEIAQEVRTNRIYGGNYNPEYVQNSGMEVSNSLSRYQVTGPPINPEWEGGG